MKTAAIVLARMDSRRFPGKVLYTIHGRPLIEHVILRAGRAVGVSATIIATSTRRVDDPIASWGASHGVEVFRGSTNNVALRCDACASSVGADAFIRLNGDSPFPDPCLLDRGISLLKRRDDAVLATNLLPRSYPYGISVEVIRRSHFSQCIPLMNMLDAEHVTRYLYSESCPFPLVRLPVRSPDLSHLRTVVDTPEDAKAMERIFDTLGSSAHSANYLSIANVLGGLDSHNPEK